MIPLTSGPRVVTEDLLPMAHASRHARNVVTAACVLWGLNHLAGIAALIVSELVSNVVDHAHTMMTMEVAVRGGHLQLTVSDGSVSPPVLRADHRVTNPRGLGLRLVDVHSAAWGFTMDNGGKSVWAKVHLEETS